MNTRQGQTEFMRDWLPFADDYLDILIQHEGHPADRLCHKGCHREGNWRCLDCFGKPLFCTDCCRSSHVRCPFHRVEMWRGEYFAPSTLSASGVILHLGHGGLPCDNALSTPEGDWEDEDDEDQASMDNSGIPESEDLPMVNEILASLAHDKSSNRKRRLDPEGNPIFTIIDRTGIHNLAVRPCTCPGPDPIHKQLLKMGLYPATQRSPRTAFTFAVLDDLRLMNLECKIAANSFFNYLRRLTDPIFPYSQPVSVSLVFVGACS